MPDELSRLRAEKAEARLAELRAEVKKLREEVEKRERERDAANEGAEWSARLVSRLRKALSFYGTESNHVQRMKGPVRSTIDEDGGRLARETLAVSTSELSDDELKARIADETRCTIQDLIEAERRKPSVYPFLSKERRSGKDRRKSQRRSGTNCARSEEEPQRRSWKERRSGVDRRASSSIPPSITSPFGRPVMMTDLVEARKEDLARLAEIAEQIKRGMPIESFNLGRLEEIYVLGYLAEGAGEISSTEKQENKREPLFKQKIHCRMPSAEGTFSFGGGESSTEEQVDERMGRVQRVMHDIDRETHLDMRSNDEKVEVSGYNLFRLKQAVEGLRIPIQQEITEEMIERAKSVRLFGLRCDELGCEDNKSQIWEVSGRSYGDFIWVGDLPDVLRAALGLQEIT